MNNPDYSQFTEGVQASTNDLTSLSALVEQMAEQEDRVRIAEEELKKEQERLRTLAEHDIPELMLAIGVEEFTTTSGLKVSIAKSIRASIPVANREKAFAWLEKHGYSGLIKREVRVGFRREDGEKAESLLSELQGEYDNVAEKQEVHPSTLKSWVKGRLEEDEDIPMELFGAVELRKAKVKHTS